MNYLILIGFALWMLSLWANRVEKRNKGNSFLSFWWCRDKVEYCDFRNNKIWRHHINGPDVTLWPKWLLWIKLKKLWSSRDHCIKRTQVWQNIHFVLILNENIEECESFTKQTTNRNNHQEIIFRLHWIRKFLFRNG